MVQSHVKPRGNGLHFRSLTGFSGLGFHVRAIIYKIRRGAMLDCGVRGRWGASNKVPRRTSELEMGVSPIKATKAWL
jgi:hypothetical protein